ncbi:MAG TPA: formimidoylglutamate deiminase [Acetobacteraceae bacterium]|nr:formimidoylglutamate deiminase [Acetobacteraceae bacterium]
MQALFFDQALLPDGWARGARVRIAAGRIAGLEHNAQPQPGDARYVAAVPGVPNLHSHAFQRGMAGLAETRGPEDDNFWTWREVMYRFLDGMDPEDVEAVTAQAFMEMLEGGFTRVGEFHYLHNDRNGRPYADPAELSRRVAAAAAQTGIRLTLLPVFYAHGGFGAAPPAPGQRRFVTTLDGFARLLEAVRGFEGVTVGVAPHSLRAVSPPELAAVCAMQEGGPIHIHAAEQVREVEDCLAWSGARPVEWLLEHAGVDARWCLIHATHMTPGETEGLARSGAVAGLCPVTEANLGDGIFPADAFRALGGGYGVGTDSNVSIGVAQELRTLEYGQRLALRARNVMAGEEGRSTGRALFEATLESGAAALGAEAPRLSEGAPADLVALDPGLVEGGGDRVLDGWIFSAGRVDSVWVGGEQLVAGGRHRARDAIEARARQTLRRLLG